LSIWLLCSWSRCVAGALTPGPCICAAGQRRESFRDRCGLFRIPRNCFSARRAPEADGRRRIQYRDLPGHRCQQFAPPPRRRPSPWPPRRPHLLLRGARGRASIEPCMAGSRGAVSSDSALSPCSRARRRGRPQSRGRDARRLAGSTADRPGDRWPRLGVEARVHGVDKRRAVLEIGRRRFPLATTARADNHVHADAGEAVLLRQCHAGVEQGLSCLQRRGCPGSVCPSRGVLRPPIIESRCNDRPVSHVLGSAHDFTVDIRGNGRVRLARQRCDPVVLLPSAGHEQHDYDEIRELLPDGPPQTSAYDWPGQRQSPAGTDSAHRAAAWLRSSRNSLESLAPGGAVLAGQLGGRQTLAAPARRSDGQVLVKGSDDHRRRLASRDPGSRPAVFFCALMSRHLFVRGIYPCSPALSSAAYRCRPAGLGQAPSRLIAHCPGRNGSHRDLAQLQPSRARSADPGREDHGPHRADLGTLRPRPAAPRRRDGPGPDPWIEARGHRQRSPPAQRPARPPSPPSSHRSRTPRSTAAAGRTAPRTARPPRRSSSSEGRSDRHARHRTARDRPSRPIASQPPTRYLSRSKRQP